MSNVYYVVGDGTSPVFATWTGVIVPVESYRGGAPGCSPSATVFAFDDLECAVLDGLVQFNRNLPALLVPRDRFEPLPPCRSV